MFVYSSRPPATHLSKPSEFDERQSVKSPTERDHPDNEHIHRSTRHSDDSGEYITTLDRDPTNQIHLNRSPVDTNLPSRMSANTSQFPTSDRERRIEDENQALKIVINRLFPSIDSNRLFLLGK